MTLVRRYAAIAAFAALATSGAAFADNDCTDPISEWKPRELLRQEVERRDQPRRLLPASRSGA